jgi:uncharacterized protein (DUF427 family)
VRVGGTLIADTTAALTLREADYPAVLYIPRADAHTEHLERSDNETYCPYKGEAAYYSVKGEDGQLIKDAIWTYETPYSSVEQISGHLAFYPQHATFDNH